MATALNENPSALRLVSIQEGCMEVTFLIPTVKADTIFTGDWKQVSDQSEELQAASLISITCNNNTFNTKEGSLTSVKSKGPSFSKCQLVQACQILSTYLFANRCNS